MNQLPAPGFSNDPEADDTSTEALEQELTHVKAELEEYQGLIEELPSIYEGKFRHQLRGVAQDIRRLLEERQALQQQIDHALQGDEPSAALPAAEPSPDPSDVDADWSSPHPDDAPPAPVQPPTRLILLSALTAFLVAALVAAVGLWSRSRAPQVATPAEPPAPVQTPPADTSPPDADAAAASDERSGPLLRLRARGQCWVEVRNLEGETLFMNTLRAGEERSLPLGDGLQLLAGRPDLLDVATGDDDFRLFGAIDQIDWVVIRPPAEPEPAS